MEGQNGLRHGAKCLCQRNFTIADLNFTYHLIVLLWKCKCAASVELKGCCYLEDVIVLGRKWLKGFLSVPSPAMWQWEGQHCHRWVHRKNEERLFLLKVFYSIKAPTYQHSRECVEYLILGTFIFTYDQQSWNEDVQYTISSWFYFC